MLRDVLLDLLDRAERHVREHVTGEFRDFFLRDLPVFRRAADHPDERYVLGALEKFLTLTRPWWIRDERLRAELEPFIATTRAARERLGGSSVLDE